MARRLHVEVMIRCDLDDLWRRTQESHQHQRWDVRFTRIERLPGRATAGRGGSGTRCGCCRSWPWTGSAPGAGERVAPGGSRTSAPRFASRHPLSPIRSGSGYWRCVPTDAGRPLPHGVRLHAWLGPAGRPAGPSADGVGHRLVVRQIAAVARGRRAAGGLTAAGAGGRGRAGPYDEDLGRFRIDVAVTNQRFGPLFGCRGTFTAAYPACRDVPERVKPVREQART